MPQHGKSKVPKLEDTISISVDVVWLHIQMQHAICMQKVQTLQMACHYGRWLSQTCVSLQCLHRITSRLAVTQEQHR